MNFDLRKLSAKFLGTVLKYVKHSYWRRTRTCSIDWDGGSDTGTEGYSDPYNIKNTWDKQSNQTQLYADWVTDTDFSLRRQQSYDELERMERLDVELISGQVDHEADWSYLGPRRIDTETRFAVDGTVSSEGISTYDAKRRRTTMKWNEPEATEGRRWPRSGPQGARHDVERQCETSVLIAGNTETYDRMGVVPFVVETPWRRRLSSYPVLL